MPSKIAIALAGTGGTIALGLFLMAVGTQAVLDDVAQGEGRVSYGELLEIGSDMDPDTEPVGVFAVHVLEAVGTDDAAIKGGDLSANVIDPLGAAIVSVPIESQTLEAKFDAEIEGRYTLLISSETDAEATVFGAIGPLPDDGAKALAFIPFYMLLAGIMGMAGLAVYGFAGRRSRGRGAGI